jgi:hypothetical protein
MRVGARRDCLRARDQTDSVIVAAEPRCPAPPIARRAPKPNHAGNPRRAEVPVRNGQRRRRVGLDPRRTFRFAALQETPDGDSDVRRRVLWNDLGALTPSVGSAFQSCEIVPVRKRRWSGRTRLLRRTQAAASRRSIHLTQSSRSRAREGAHLLGRDARATRRAGQVRVLLGPATVADRATADRALAARPEGQRDSSRCQLMLT